MGETAALCAAFSVSALAALITGALALTRPGTRGRAHWALLGAAALCSAGAAVAPGAASDALRLLSAVVAVLALAAVPGAPPHFSGQARTIVDGLITASSVLLVAWVAGLDDLWGQTTAAHGGLTLTVAVARVAVAAAAIVMLTRSRGAARARLASLAGGFTLIAVGSGAVAYVDLGGAAGWVWVLELGWAAGWGLIAWGAWRSRDDLVEEEHEPGLPTRASVLIPSVPFIAAVLAAADAAVEGEFEGSVIWIAA